ncbi:unnamed protein product [Lactuca virosa]|uniref:Retrotransposon Copia-like N-terminal domain-containing protein n=1 Tax=Lactuca virosa TaxID=75947 RepID=A0AAU9NBY0_9ASTR|nr:unnamed protein product [Lactuca virosa]
MGGSLNEDYDFITRKHSLENTLKLVTQKGELMGSRINELFEKTVVLCLSVDGMNDLEDVEAKSSLHPQSSSFCNLKILVVSECAECKQLVMDSESTMTNDSGSSGMTNSQSLPVFYNPNAIMAHTHLTKENYVNWSTLLKTLLRAHQLLFVIDPNPPPKTLADGKENPDHHKWKNATDLICCWIKGTVTPAIQPYLNSCDTAPATWSVLAKRFGSISAIQIENLQDRLHNLKKPTDLSVSDYLLQPKTISDSLTA